MRFRNKQCRTVIAWVLGISLMAIAVASTLVASTLVAKWVVLNREGVHATSREELLAQLGDRDDRTVRTQKLRLAADAQPHESVVALRVIGRALTAYECEYYCSIGTLVLLELYDCEIPAGYTAKMIGANRRLQIVGLEFSRCDLEPLQPIADHESLLLISTFQSKIPESQIQTIVDRGVHVNRDQYFRLTR